MKNEFVNSYINFADNLYRVIADETSNDNLLISPYSMLVAMGMLLEAADMDSHEEIKSLLCPDLLEEEFVSNLKEISELLQNCPGVEFSDANAFAVKPEYKPFIKQEFIDMLKNMFNADVFSDADNMERLNKWVEEKTKGMIKRTIAKEPDFSLVNAIAFIAKWAELYEEDDIWEDENFTNADGNTESVTMLFSNENYYFEDKHIKGFAKPYKGAEYCFAAFIDKRKWKLDTSEITVKKISELFRSAERKVVNVYIPEFKFDSDLETSNAIQELGINSVFDMKTADLSRMVNLREAFVKEIIHKTHIEVDRSGTKAAAYTEVVMELGCLPPDFEEVKEVRLDRPFAFAIINNETGLPIFVGKVNYVN